MHKEYYDSIDSVALVTAPDLPTLKAEIDVKVADIEARVPKPLIIGTAYSEVVDIRGDTLFVGSVTYRNRKKV